LLNLTEHFRFPDFSLYDIIKISRKNNIKN